MNEPKKLLLVRAPQGLTPEEIQNLQARLSEGLDSTGFTFALDPEPPTGAAIVMLAQAIEDLCGVNQAFLEHLVAQSTSFEVEDNVPQSLDG